MRPLLLGALALLLIGCSVTGEARVVPADLGQRTSFVGLQPAELLMPATVTPALYEDDIRGGIDVYNPATGRRIRQIPTSALGLAVDTKGNLYVADAYDQVVKIFAPGKKRPFRILAGAGGGPAGVSLDSRRNVYVAVEMRAGGSPGQIAVYKPGHTQPSEILKCAPRIIAHYRGIATDSGGDVFVTGNPRGRDVEFVAEIPKGKPCKLLDRVVADGFSAVTVTENADLVLVLGSQRAEVFHPPYSRVAETIALPGESGAAEVALGDAEASLWVATYGGAVLEYPFPAGGPAKQTIYDETGAGWGVAIAPPATP